MWSDAFLPVSVIIANYNSENYLNECVRSINAGQWPLEILIVDDCSTDASLPLALQLAAEFSNVRVFQLPKNGGITAARKVAIFAAQCQWITIIDADDYIEKDAIATALAKAIAEDSDMCIWQLWRFDDKRAWCAMNLDNLSFPRTGRQAVIGTLGRYSIHPLGVCKKELYISAYRHFNEHCSDNELIARLAISVAKQVSVCDKRYFYRVNPNSITGLKHVKQLSKLQAAIWVVKFSKNYPEVSPAVAGSRAISYAWNAIKNRKHYGTKATSDALSIFIAQMLEHGNLKKWLWRYPKQAAKFALIWLRYR